MYTIRDLAEKLGVHQNTVRRWINSKQLECIRIGKGIRITEEQLQKFLDNPTK